MLTKPSFSLFEVAVESAHRDIVVVTGNEHECDAVAVRGHVKLAVTGESLMVRRMRLWLTGELDVNYRRPVSEVVSDDVFERFATLSVEWGNLLVDADGKISFGNYGSEAYVRYNRVPQMVKQQQHNTPSEPNRPMLAPKVPIKGPNGTVSCSGCDGTPFPNSKAPQFQLKKGNYLIPFRVTLPANVAESVEGIPHGAIHYKLVCCIERPGVFDRDAWSCRFFRICRTLHPHSFHLVDAIDVDNNWPGKISYQVRLHSRGVPVGGRVPINMLVIPLSKHIEVHLLKAHIVQQSQIQVKSHPWLASTEERIVGRQKLDFHRVESPEVPVDRDPDGHGEPFTISTVYRVPSDLSEINPSCDVAKGLVKVRHRLVLQLILKNNDEGHLSEVRANLPIWVYISPHSPAMGPIYTVDEDRKFRVFRTGREEPLFRKLSPGAEVTSAADRNLSPPPVYNRHTEDVSLDSQNEPSGYFDIPVSGEKVRTPSEVPTYHEAISEAEEVSEPAPGYDGELPPPVQAPTPAPGRHPPSKTKKIVTNLLKSPKPPNAKLNGRK
ncbi:hypothetical protein DICA0_C14884 [Diutina catenulata]